MIRTIMQRFAGAVALLVVVAWSGCDGRGEPTATAPPRTELARPHDDRTGDAGARPTAPPALRAPADPPPEAYEVLALIARGGPFPYRQDGGVFQNRERRLPARPRGYYREYTVPTPGSPDRGPRRIVTGGDPPIEQFYTGDHYRSFRPIEVTR